MGMNTYYKKKRKKTGLAPSDIAKELGIDYKRYNLIENGVIRMPANLIDKFNEIIGRGKNENMINKLNNKEIVDKFWDEMSVKKSNGKRSYVLFDKMREFNIDTLTELGNLLGVSKSLIQTNLRQKDNATYNFKNNIYLFFQNELNIQEPKNKVSGVAKKIAYELKKQPSVNDEKYDELLNWFKTFDWEEVKNKYNIRYVDIVKATGLSDNWVYRFVTKNVIKPTYDKLVVVKKYFEILEQKTTDEKNTMTFCNMFEEINNTTTIEEELVKELPELEESTDKVVLEEPRSGLDDIIDTYTDEVNDNNELINYYNMKIEELQSRNNVCNEVIEALKQAKGE